MWYQTIKVIMQIHPHANMPRLCPLFGATRQAHYEAHVQQNKITIVNIITLILVN